MSIEVVLFNGRWVHINCDYAPRGEPNYTFPMSPGYQYCKHCMAVYSEKGSYCVSISNLSPMRKEEGWQKKLEKPEVEGAEFTLGSFRK